MRILTFLIVILSLWSSNLGAQQASKALSAVRSNRAEQIANWPNLIKDSLVAPRWLARGDQLVFWDAIGPDGGTWVLVDASTGKKSPLIDPKALHAQLSAISGTPLTMPTQIPFEMTADDDNLLFRLAGHSYRLNLTSATIRRAAEHSFDALQLEGGKLSGRGDQIALQQGFGFAVINSAGNTIFAKTGSANYSWQLPDNPWSPDGRLAVWEIDQRSVHHIPIVDHSSSLEQVSMIPYPKVGTPLAKAVLYLFDPKSGFRQPIRSTQEEGYRWLVGWRDDGVALLLHMARDGKRLDLNMLAPDGKERLLLREERRDTKIADLNFATTGWSRQVTMVPGGGFLWLSERDGWRHVYQYDDDGRLLSQRTRGYFPTTRVDHAAADGGILVTASADIENPYDEQLYRVDSSTTNLHPVAIESGSHLAQPSPSGRYLIDSWSSWTRPRVRELRTADGTLVTRLTSADVSALQSVRPTLPERFTVVAADDRTLLHGALFKPDGFDPALRYPVVAYIYGGPYGTVLSRNYAGNTMMRRAESIAAAGFVVIAVDVRGSFGRDKRFSDATHGRIGTTEVADYIAALRQTASTRPWMDLSRVGIHGHSWGGYFTIRAMLTAPEMFKAGYAGAPGALDEDALVNEPNMELRDANPAGYAAGNNLLLANRLKGSLRIMHGSADVSAPLSSTMRVVKSLISSGKHVDLVIMPGVDHNPQGMDEQYYRDDVLRFFARELGPPKQSGVALDGAR